MHIPLHGFGAQQGPRAGPSSGLVLPVATARNLLTLIYYGLRDKDIPTDWVT